MALSKYEAICERHITIETNFHFSNDEKVERLFFAIVAGRRHLQPCLRKRAKRALASCGSISSWTGDARRLPQHCREAFKKVSCPVVGLRKQLGFADEALPMELASGGENRPSCARYMGCTTLHGRHGCPMCRGFCQLTEEKEHRCFLFLILPCPRKAITDHLRKERIWLQEKTTQSAQATKG